MLCPYCHHTATKVVDKRDNNENNVTRRRRECEQCGKRFTTYERIETVNLYVIKRSGKITEFDREKLKHSTLKAVGKRISEQGVEEIVQRVEQELLNYDSTEIRSEQIGELLMTILKEKDPVSFLRFASVYKNFQNITDFRAAISELEQT